MGRSISSTSSRISRGLKRCAAMIRESRKSRVTTRKALPSGSVTDFAGRALLVRGRDVREPRRGREPPRCAVPSSELLAREASTPCPECDGSAPLLASMLRDVFIRPSRQATRSLSGNRFLVQQRTRDHVHNLIMYQKMIGHARSRGWHQESWRGGPVHSRKVSR